MKKGIHPENYRMVAFKDMSNGDVFLTRSTANSKETLEVDGKEYPLLKLEISRETVPDFAMANIDFLSIWDLILSSLITSQLINSLLEI